MNNFWNQRYQDHDWVYGQQPNDFLKQHTHLFPTNAKILLICEGEGRNAIFLAQHGFDVTATDQSEIGMTKAKIWAKKENLELKTLTMDIVDFQFGKNDWDVIISIFGHLPSKLRKITHQRIIQSLKPKGLFLFEAYNPQQLEFNTGGPKDLDFFITQEIIQLELTALKPIILNEKIRIIHEGDFHNGESSIIQFIGEKN